MKPIIKVDSLSKRYRIGTRAASAYTTLRETLSAATRLSFERMRARATANHKLMWALKDVSFEVRPGEVLGLVGHNGAGKSTLLKILSRVTEPTEGRVELYGRIGSLLEIGTGFHPELTGRENLFLNGAILGMKRAEIERKFDEIVAFSEIEEFIDTPVKWYSSGMYLRLAFSVAVHLEPEILVLDEVLAVGDMSFQLKCFNKIQDITKDGRTILFVSHNMQAVSRLCGRAIYLSHGEVLADGPSHEVVSTYLNSRLKTAAEKTWGRGAEAPGDEVARLRAVRLRTAGGELTSAIDVREPVGVEMEYEVLTPGRQLVPNFHFYNEGGVCAFVVLDSDPQWRRRPRPAGRYRSTAWVPANYLSEGTMLVSVALTTSEPVVVHFFEREAVTFHVVDTAEGETARGDYKGEVGGVVRPLLKWDTQFVPRAHEGEAPAREGNLALASSTDAGHI